MKIKKYDNFCGCDKVEENIIINENTLSDKLKYHFENDKYFILTENLFRYGTKGYINLINEARKEYLNGNIELSSINREILLTDIGESVVYCGKKIWLDLPIENDINEKTKYRGKSIETNKPKRDSSGGKAYKVYVRGCNDKSDSNPSGVKLIRFGSGGLKAKINDSGARKRYDARHGCSDGKHDDKCKAGYWSCRLPRYAKALGLKGSGTWW